jgi:hypothetical protein
MAYLCAFIAAASLRIAGIEFSSLGVAVVVRFNAPTNMAGMIGIDDCSKVLAQTDLFGDGAYCVWSSADVLNIWLGSHARVEIGDLIQLKSDVITYVYPQSTTDRSSNARFIHSWPY